MKVYSLVFLFCIFFAPVCFAETVDQWPVDFSNPQNQLSSPFGPRLKASDDYRYDFHRGIDIPGETTDEVKAVKYGKVYRIYEEGDPDSPYPESGNIVILRHTFSSPYTFHNEEQTYYYTLYAHLSSIDPGLVLNNYVDAGTRLGYIGNSGDTDFNHLHFEIRVGTTCSLSSSCSHGYDPHINPLHFLPYSNNDSLDANTTINNNDVVVAMSSPRDELDINKFQVETVSTTGETQQKILNFDTREGVDASTTTTLDQQEYNGIFIEPAQFSARSEQYAITVTFRDLIAADTDHILITIKDIFDNTLYSSQINFQESVGGGDGGDGGTDNNGDGGGDDNSDDNNGGSDGNSDSGDGAIEQPKEIIPPDESVTIETPVVDENNIEHTRQVITNGKVIQVLVDDEIITEKKVNNYLPKKKQFTLAVHPFYDGYEHVIFVSSRNGVGKIITFQLTKEHALIQKRIKKINNGKTHPVRIHVKKKAGVFTTVFRNHQLKKIWKWHLTKKGRLLFVSPSSAK